MVVAPQHPQLLTSYRYRPPWEVAGVDYGVGYSSATTLADPSKISAPGVSVDTTAHVVSVNGNNVVLIGYDFSLAGGWTVDIRSGTNITIADSNFLVGLNNLPPVRITGSAENVIIARSNFDGGAHPTLDYLVMYDAQGTLVFENNWLKNTASDGLWFLKGTRLIARQNMFESLGHAPGSHADAIQFTHSNNTDSQIVYNTFLFEQHLAVEGYLPGEGIQVESQADSIGIFRAEVGNNTIVSTRPRRVNSYLIALRGNPTGSNSNVLDGVNCHDNYMDRGAAYGFFYPVGGSNHRFSGNRNMVTGAIVTANQR